MSNVFYSRAFFLEKIILISINFSKIFNEVRNKLPFISIEIIFFDKHILKYVKNAGNFSEISANKLYIRNTVRVKVIVFYFLFFYKYLMMSKYPLEYIKLH